jgi:hypothetical protein
VVGWFQFSVNGSTPRFTWSVVIPGLYIYLIKSRTNDEANYGDGRHSSSLRGWIRISVIANRCMVDMKPR